MRLGCFLFTLPSFAYWHASVCSLPSLLKMFSSMCCLVSTLTHTVVLTLELFFLISCISPPACSISPVCCLLCSVLSFLSVFISLYASFLGLFFYIQQNPGIPHSNPHMAQQQALSLSFSLSLSTPSIPSFFWVICMCVCSCAKVSIVLYLYFLVVSSNRSGCVLPCLLLCCGTSCRCLSEPGPSSTYIQTHTCTPCPSGIHLIPSLTPRSHIVPPQTACRCQPACFPAHHTAAPKLQGTVAVTLPCWQQPSAKERAWREQGEV